MTSEFKSVHLQHDIPDLSEPFQITVSPGTDIWDKPPSTHSFNAPIIYRTSTVGTFKSARVTVTAAWKDQYDQGGLFLGIQTADTPRWVKTGIEFLDGVPLVGTVAKDRWADWSLRPLLAETLSIEGVAIIEVENASDGSLWVWLVSEGGQKLPLREVTWWGDLAKETEVWIGVYAAKPGPHGEKDELVVKFEGLQIQ
jgi:regulation of enolase protein 1 (concanavalin A-like superfamily)